MLAIAVSGAILLDEARVLNRSLRFGGLLQDNLKLNPVAKIIDVFELMIW